MAPRCPSSSTSSVSTVCTVRSRWTTMSEARSTSGYCGSGGVRAGVHSNTNVYIEPSNNDWIMPRQSTFRSKMHTVLDWNNTTAVVINNFKLIQQSVVNIPMAKTGYIPKQILEWLYFIIRVEQAQGPKQQLHCRTKVSVMIVELLLE